jgi:hypothetical protein
MTPNLHQQLLLVDCNSTKFIGKPRTMNLLCDEYLSVLRFVLGSQIKQSTILSIVMMNISSFSLNSVHTIYNGRC